MNELVREWLEKAENDFQSVDILLHAGESPIPDTAAFHAQQAAEKYLKAFLQKNQVRFEYTHSLILLLDLCLTQDKSFETIREDLAQLDHFSVAVRYPGVRVSVEIAEDALEIVKRIREFVKSKLA